MKFDTVSVATANPDAVGEWYADALGLEARADGRGASIAVGSSTLRLERAESARPYHVAFRTLAAPEAVRDWLADRAPVLTDGGRAIQRFDFLDASAIYFEDPEGNVLECLCYDFDADRRTDPSGGAFDGVTEVGLPAEETVAFVDWLREAPGLSTLGEPSEAFTWIGDGAARFVVVPAGRAWYPTDRPSSVAPMRVSVVEADGNPGVYEHPELPYEIAVKQAEE